MSCLDKQKYFEDLLQKIPESKKCLSFMQQQTFERIVNLPYKCEFLLYNKKTCKSRFWSLRHLREHFKEAHHVGKFSQKIIVF